MKDLVSHQLVKYLEARGIAHVFGLCGHTNIAVLAALEKSRIKFVNVRHEQIAAHMADGYARASGRAAVLLTHLGPGLTNAATGVANAALDSIPLVVIAGDVPTHYHGKHPHQEVNLHADAAQCEIYRPFVKRAWRVDRPDLFPEIIEKAFALAESGRPGAVLVDVPMDIFSKEVDVALHIGERNTALSEGRHGVHIHEVGNCAALCAAAGGHFDPGQPGSAEVAGHRAVEGLGDRRHAGVVAPAGRLRATGRQRRIHARALVLRDSRGQVIQEFCRK